MGRCPANSLSRRECREKAVCEIDAEKLDHNKHTEEVIAGVGRKGGIGSGVSAGTCSLDYNDDT